MPKLPWTRILIGLLVAVLAFSWYQQRQITALQYQEGTALAEDYRELGGYLREMRSIVGTVLSVHRGGLW